MVQDTTSIVQDRLSMLLRNGAVGLVLVVIVMSLFFRPGLALWAAMGLPVAMAGSLAWMAATGLTLNMITMVALLMAIGIVMDDSIVLSDSIAVLQDGRLIADGDPDTIHRSKEVQEAYLGGGAKLE